MPALSVVIITLNEEKNIGRCLDSVKAVADEMVVVDSFSSDRTEEICKEKGVVFHQNKWPGYGAQKNLGHSLARHDFIFSIDADETLSEELTSSLLHWKEYPGHDAYAMNRMTNYCGHWIRHCGWYPDTKVRLFDKRKVRWDLELVHEELIMEPGSTTGFLRGDLLHYSFHTVEDHLRQVEKYSSLVAKQFFERGKKAGWMKMMLSGVVRFLRDYFFRLGILDGRAGFTVCRYSAKAAYLKYKKLRDLNRHG